jgi:uncharacterized protein YecE (DUF72 family)
MNRWYLGTIGFSYKDWLGGFYPPGTYPRAYLPYYSKVFNAVEIDTTFHSIPRGTIVQSWAASTPAEFRFCVKTPRLITHDLRLTGTQGIMGEFIESILPIKEKLGPILIQFPPSFTRRKLSLLDEFLKTLPQPYQYAVELRHASWYTDDTFQLLSQYHVGWVTIDFPNLPKKINLTADFLYIRWIGINNQYQYHSYEREDTTPQLRWWLHEINTYIDRIPRIYGFFNNDYAGFAAGTCLRFKRLAGFTDKEDQPPFQERLF